MTVLNRLKCLNSLHLKLLAMALMLCDHMWATVIPGAAWMTSIGRLAFPIFAFQIAEGFAAPIISKDIWGGSFCLP